MKLSTLVVIGMIGLFLVFFPGIFGLYLAFKASVILGVVALLIEPSPAIIGWVAIFGRPDLCDLITKWLHLPF